MRKGAIQIGADADVAIWNPNREEALTAKKLHDRTGYTPYEGRRVTGWPETIIARGNVVVDDGALLAKPGDGRFLRR